MSLIEFREEGLYCPPAKVYIDPWRPVNKALITHAHADHARWGMKSYLAHELSVPVMKHRLGQDINCQGLKYDERLSINGVEISFHPAGHIPGSSQIRLEHKGEVWVISGDYKTQADRISTPFEPIKCHHFVTESTFGLPIYRWPTEEEVALEINQWWEKNRSEGKCSLIAAYSLGKAQRILSLLDASIGPIYCHGAVANTNDLLLEQGLDLPEYKRIEGREKKSDFKNAMVICPPSALGSSWSKKLQPYRSAFASGWMALRGARRRRAADRGFVISDHADWPGLNQAVKATEAENIYVTHGYQELYAQWLREEMQLNATAVKTLFEGESLDQNNSGED